MSKRDGLTGLYNDRYFHLKLDEEVRLAKRRKHDLILFFMDMDHFKEINDTFGHMTGSHVLQDVGTILRKVVPSKDVTIARYGGDEFVIIFPQTSLAQALTVAESVCKSIQKFTFTSVPIHPEAKVVMIEGRLTCSIGLSSLRDHVDLRLSNDNIRHLLIRKADEAMYRAKLSGKGCVFLAESG
ncbi:MAG: GGDEF domain-containing protein [Nitrospira sp.]|nr:GGDEF domain-containing protein [Candidatus Manganitrophaceae bacterium]